MKLKTKLCSTIVMFCLTIVTLMVGVWAVKSANVNIGGTLSFVAQGIEATISKGTMSNGTWQTASHATTKLKQIEITKTDTTSTLATKFSSWSGINLNFNENGDDITISFSITNNSDTNSIAVDVSTAYTSATNCTIAIDTSSATIDPNASQSFTLTMKITDKDINASMTNFTVVFTMNLVKPVTLQYDSTNDYYYVEMGTYNNSAVRWRLVGVDGAKFTGSSAPASGTTGTFILETLIDRNALSYVFDETNYSNEYATSDIRTYLNGEYKTFLSLTDDATYNAITAREISDLYTDMAWRTDDKYQVEDISLPSGATGADKLWLMSVAEVYTLLGGGTIGADGTIASSWSTEVKAGCNWDADNTSDYYWLRSPLPNDSGTAFIVHGNGGWNRGGLGYTRAVRPAFNVRFKYTAPKPYELIQDEKGFYVEMGTYQSNPVKWRLVGVKESGASETTKFTGSSAPASGTTGTFILETLMVEIADKQKFNASSSDGNDYATSDIRTYLNGDYKTFLNLTDDATYNAITAREISDLYTDMAWRRDDKYQVEDISLPSGATGADKLWLMSVAEVYTLLGGGTIGADGTIASSWSTEVKAGCNWDADNTSDYYWLRSPYPGYSSNAFNVDRRGGWGNTSVGLARAVRPAFNLEF